MIGRYGNRITSAIGLIVVVALGVRLADWILTPIWPLLVVLGFIILVLNVAIRKQ